jgi:hypothetical protein
MLLYTLLETTKLGVVDPRPYVPRATKRAIAGHGTATLPST